MCRQDLLSKPWIKEGATIVLVSDWLGIGWKALIEQFETGEFDPQNETDVQAHFYHLLCSVQGRPKDHVVTTEYRVSQYGKLTRKKIDLAILKREKENAMPQNRIARLVEIKETGSRIKSKTVRKRIKKDLAKLRTAMRMNEAASAMQPWLVFFYRRNPPLKDQHQELRTLVNNTEKGKIKLMIKWRSLNRQCEPSSVVV